MSARTSTLPWYGLEMRYVSVVNRFCRPYDITIVE